MIQLFQHHTHLLWLMPLCLTHTHTPRLSVLYTFSSILSSTSPSMLDFCCKKSHLNVQYVLELNLYTLNHHRANNKNFSVKDGSLLFNSVGINLALLISDIVLKRRTKRTLNCSARSCAIQRKAKKKSTFRPYLTSYEWKNSRGLMSI